MQSNEAVKANKRHQIGMLQFIHTSHKPMPLFGWP